MRPRYNYASPPHQAEADQPSQEPTPTQGRAQRQWRKPDPYQPFSSPFQARSSSPASSISTDLGAFLSPVPVEGVQGFRASTPRIHHQPPESISSQSYIDETSIPSPEQSYADWAANENILSQPPLELTDLDDHPRSDTSSWSFADAASINHPSVQGLSNSRPPSRYFSSESEQADDSGSEEASDGGGDGDGDGDEEEGEESVPRPLRHIQTPEGGRRSEQSQTSQRHLLSSSFEHPDTALWQKRGSANTSLLSQRLDRYRKDSILSRLDQLKGSSDQGASPEDLGYSVSDTYRHIDSRQSRNSPRSRSHFRETLRANMASRESDANSSMRRSQSDHRLALTSHHHATSIGSRAESRRSATNYDEYSRSKNSTPSQYRGILRQTARYVPSREFPPRPYSQSHKTEEFPSNDLAPIKQSQAKAIGKTLEKLETLLDGDTNVLPEADDKIESSDEKRWRIDTYDVPNSAVDKTQKLLERIWQLQRSLDSKETELLDARRHGRWLEDQLQAARRRIDKLELEAEARHQLQDRLHSTESSANQANQRVSELLHMNFKLVQDHEGLMRQIGQQAAITGSLSRETPWRGREMNAISRASGDFTNTRMAELQDRLRKLWDDSKQLEEYVKERSASRLSTRSPVPDTRIRPQNPSPRLLTQQEGGYQFSDDEEDNESTSEGLVDLLSLLKTESEQHRNQLVKTVHLLAANVSGDEGASQHRTVRIPHGLGALVTKIRKMERRYEERERQLNKIIGVNRRKNKQEILSWKRRWENQTREWPSAVKPLLTQLDSQDSDDDGKDSDNGSQGDVNTEEQEEDKDDIIAAHDDDRLASVSLQDFNA